MKALLPLILLILCLSTSCGRHAGDTSLYCNSGRAKPIVAVLPVIDSSQTAMHWNISEELTTEIQKRIYQSSKLYLLRQEVTENMAHNLNKMDVKQISSDEIDSLGAAEFAIVTELLDQKESAYEGGKEGTSDVGGLFSIAMRVRILDLRGAVPKVILQEVIDHDHVIPRFYVGCDYNKIPWGSSGFELTPMGRAHSRIVRELIAHAEGYIGVSKG